MEISNTSHIICRRSILFFLPIVLFLVGCSRANDEIERTSIGFSCTTAGATRVSETTADNLQFFRVSAVWTKPNGTYEEEFMKNQLVENAGSLGWQYAPTMYWPGYGTVSFFAYTPAISAGMTAFSIGKEDNTLAIDYTVSTDAAQQEDFMVATDLNRMTSPVMLNFRHALSFVSFEACSATGVAYRVTNIELVELNSSATLVGTPDAETGLTTWAWTNTANPVTYTVAQTLNSPHVESTTTYIPIGNTLAVLPQILSENFEIVVTYQEASDSGTDLTLRRKPQYFDGFVMGSSYTFKLRLGVE